MAFSDEKLTDLGPYSVPVFSYVLLLNGEIVEGNKWVCLTSDEFHFSDKVHVF